MPNYPGEWHRPNAKWQRLRPDVKRLRREGTPAEDALWEYLRNGQLAGFKFRRQHPIGQFIVDFCCPAARLIVELDGPVHDDRQAADSVRQTFLEDRGYKVIRFRNEDVFGKLKSVLERISTDLGEAR